MAVYVVRDNNRRVGRINGRLADRSCSQCCGAACPRVWKALPCHAGEAGTTQCDCPASYPTREIYVCVDATCALGSGLGVGRVIRAEYNEFPGIKFCFHVLNAPGDPTYAIEDVPPTATIVMGELECQSGTFGNGGCDATACIAAGQRALWVRGRSCKAGAFCPWVCAANVNATNDCVVRGIDRDMDGNPLTPACCHFVGGAADVGYFDQCPNPRADWNPVVYPDAMRSCCQCQAAINDGCGGWVYRERSDRSTGACPRVCSQIPYLKALYCCCGTIVSKPFSWFYELREFGGQVQYSENFSGTCVQGGSITGTVCSSNGQCTSETRSCFVACDSDVPIQTLGSQVSSGCWGDCPPPPDQATSHVVSGTIDYRCNGLDAVVQQVTNYVWGDVRTEKVEAHVVVNRVIGEQCDGGCVEDGYIGDPPGSGLRVPTPRWSRAMNRVRGGRVISVGSGAGAASVVSGGGCAGCGSGGVMTPTLSELAMVSRTRTDRGRR